MNECNHAIGVKISDDGGWLLLSQFSKEARNLRREFDEWARNPHASVFIIQEKKSFTDLEFIAEDYDMFEYCPYCGKEINLPQ